MSSPERVVRSIHETALSNQAAWLSFFTDLLAGNDLQRLSMADVFACTAKTQSRSSAVPGFRMIGGGLLGKLIGLKSELLDDFHLLARLDLLP